MGHPGAKLATLALAGWLVALGTIVWPEVARWFLLVPLALIISVATKTHASRKTVPLLLASLPLCAVMVSTLWHHELRNPTELTEVDGTTASVRLVTERTIVSGDTFARGVITAVENQEVHPAPAMVFFDAASMRHAPGTALWVSGSVKSADRADTRAWLIFADSFAVAHDAPRLQAWADNLRATFLETTSTLGGDGGALLPGLSLGDTQHVSDSLEADMRQAALAHLVAVSGANVALVVGLAVLAVALFGGGVWWRVGVGLFSLGFFILLVTPEPSVIRASVMATIVLLATAISRPQAGLVALSLTVWLLLLIDPWHAVEIAFVLSVAATAGIVLGFMPATRALTAVLPTPVAALCALPLVAQLAVQPFVILLRPTIPTYGIIANVLAAPFVPFVTVSGLAGAVSGWVLPGVSEFFARLGWLPATAIASIARGVGHLPTPEMAWPEAPWGFLLAALLSAGGFLMINRRARNWGAGLIAGVLVTSTLITHAPIVVSRLSMPSDWTIAQCDVGQGDALLLKTQRGVVAIDTGDDETALRRCLASTGVRRISYLVLTHFDRDHVAQSAVFHRITDTVLTGPTDNDADRKRLVDLSVTGATIRQVREGDVIDLGDYRMHILWPSAQGLGEPGNDSSIVTFFQPVSDDRPSLIALGDVGEEVQQMLGPRLTTPSVDVVKVSHHGSADQSADFYRLLSPQIALIGVGRENDYGHPTTSALTMLGSMRAWIVRSDEHGLATIHRRGGELHLWTEQGR